MTSGARPTKLTNRAYNVIPDMELPHIGTNLSYDPRDLVPQHGRHRNDVVRGEQ